MAEIQKNAPVPVIPATHSRINRSIVSDGLMALGAGVLAMAQYSKEIQDLFPQWKWIGPALIVVSGVYKIYLKQRAKAHIEHVDYSGKGEE